MALWSRPLTDWTEEELCAETVSCYEQMRCAPSDQDAEGWEEMLHQLHTECDRRGFDVM